MVRKYIKKHLDPAQTQLLQEHIAASDFSLDLKLGESESIECSIIFFDLCNFTNISWSLTRSQILAILQPMFEAISIRIVARNGMIDKYPGDGVVGFFPRVYGIEKNEIVDNAIDCATEVMYWFYNKFREKYILPKPSHTLELCAGIDAGIISIAHVGSAYHNELILLGDQVNCASKCQSKADKKEVIIGQDAVDHTHYKSIYKKYLSTGPATDIIYTGDNSRYLCYRFDWEEYSINTWISK